MASSSRSTSRQMGFEALEMRLLYSASTAPAPLAGVVDTPAARSPHAHAPVTGVTDADRQAIINEWAKGREQSHLQLMLNADSSGAEFDTALLSYMTDQFNANSHYFFQPSDVEADIQLIQDPDNLYGQPYRNSWKDLMDKARLELAHTFGTIQEPATIDWIDNPKSLGADDTFIHQLNQMDQMVDFATAYRLHDIESDYADAGDSKWVVEIQNELISFEQQEPPLSNPNDYGNESPRWWLLDTAFRTLNLEETYALLIGTPAFTPALNTLFMKEFWLHGNFLSTVTPKLPTSNWTVTQGDALSQLADMFPEYADAGQWQSVAVNNLLVPALQQQFFADGGQDEESPGYAKEVLGEFGDAYYLNHTGWPADAKALLINAANAYYQELEPDGTQPVLGDTVPAISSDVLGPLQLELGITTWTQAKLRMNGVFKLGAPAAIGTLFDDANPALGGRGLTDAQPETGDYMMRSTTAADADAQQLIFQAGPTAAPTSPHGHYDMFSIDLYGYGQPLIANPGVDTYVPGPERNRLISTPAANTLSINGENNAFITPADASKVIHVEQDDVDADHTQITAENTAYQGVGGVNGDPTVTRSIWYDYANTTIVVDWATASASNKYTVGYNLVGSTARGPNGGIHTTNSDGNNVLVVPVLQSGQSTHSAATTVFAGTATAATQYTISQTADSAVFASLIVTYQGSTPPDVSAQWVTVPTGTSAGTLGVLQNGVVVQAANFSQTPTRRKRRPHASAAASVKPAAIWSATPIDPAAAAEAAAANPLLKDASSLLD